MNRPVLLACALFSILSLSALGQVGSSRRVVTIKPELSPERVKAGDRFQLQLRLDIADGYHINSSKPTEEYLIGTQVKLEPISGFVFDPPQYPKARMRKFGFSDKALAVYEGQAVVKVAGRVSSDAKPGKYKLKGQARYQACDDRSCLPPVTQTFSVDIEVAR